MTTPHFPEVNGGEYPADLMAKQGRLYRDGTAAVKRDPVGMTYDHSRTDSDGTVHYTRDQAKGTAAGPAWWSSEHDCNPICGHHLASLCRGCNVCLSCDGCYCRED